MNYLLAHDIGTSGDKATLFTESGELVGSTVYAYKTYYAHDNWVEQDANDWWRAVCETTQKLLEKTAVAPADIACVSFSGQMMGCLCVDCAGEPLRRSIIWADSRAQTQAQAIAETIDQQTFYHITGHRNTASYGVQKLLWVKEEEPEVYRRTDKVLNAKDYICFRLTGEFATDYSDANGMTCFDINKLQWSEEIIRAAGIDRQKLPQAFPSTHVVGKVHQEAARATGLLAGTPVVLGAGDGVSANVGAGSILPGRTYCCMGTSAWITTTTERPVFDREMRTVTWVHAIPGYYAPNGTMQTAGGALSWAKEAIGDRNTSYDEINLAIEKADLGAGGVLFLPYLLGERAPRWDPLIKGAFLGLKADSTKGELLRSVLEGVTFNLDIILHILAEHIPIEEIVAIGGGARSRVWCRIMADVFGRTVKVPALIEEGGAMGAAVIGAVGVGLYDSFQEVEKILAIRQSYTPDPQAVQKYEEIKPLFDTYYYALKGKENRR